MADRIYDQREDLHATGRFGAAAPPAAADPLDGVRVAVADYHFALDSRAHGAVAAHRAINAIESALGIRWVPGAEKRRREAAHGERS